MSPTRPGFQRECRDQTRAVLNTLVRLGPGQHKFRDIVYRSGIREDLVLRRLRQLIAAGLCHRGRRGYYELTPLADGVASAPGLVHPVVTPLLDVARVSEGGVDG
ncbi:hypothetical protein ACWDA7_37520 [Streptomyces sp. NPDC001156]